MSSVQIRVPEFDLPINADESVQSTRPRRAPRPSVGANRALARRYIKLLKKALLNETGLEAEAAYYAAREALENGKRFDPAVAYDVRERAPAILRELRRTRAAGRYLRRSEIGFPFTMVGRARLNDLDRCASTVLSENVPGDLIECGAWRGGASILMRGILAAWNVTDRTVWVADSFAGLPESRHPRDTIDLSPDRHPELAVSRDRVAANFALFDLLDDQVRFLEGYFSESLPEAPIKKIAVLRLDGDLYESTMATLDALYDKVSRGGFVIVDDYGAMPPCREAIEEFRSTRGIGEPMEKIDWTGVRWRKQSPSPDP